ncbi:CCA tRNA nucleotidyltransferase [Methylobacterium sp. J-048]|uniref:CCA tRNA nucleotidyltransferase n=1 Tax=Methylobacterium sp. J-048 TaxID=2836635 RepID=UPI001FBA94F2|nr:CCA tRNA nucleotidyltransferase [Methylobacterium sp. J-048]MCJ2059647.1 CCA tRNA nucleotidyltransferase [Methylobacterium sp. J-048]
MTQVLDHGALAALLVQPGVGRTLAALDVPGAETRLVGGCVRDALLGKPSADIDLATTLLPEAVIAAARNARGLKAVPTGIEHGTITLVTEDGPIEVTTLREDVETDGRHAVVRFGSDFARDAERRDFTVNALSLGADGRLHDTVGGLADLEAGRVRFIGDPDIRIREDALRILRFFRFHARFGTGAPDEAALAACVAARDALDRLSRERVRSEFLKLLAAPGGAPMVGTLSATGLLQRITGGVAELGRLERAGAASLAPVMRLAALSVGGRHDADRLRDRLRLSKQEHIQLTGYADALADLHGRTAAIDAPAARALAAEHGLARLNDTLAILSGEPRPVLEDDARRALQALAGEGGAPRFPLAGADLVAAGLPTGPSIGRGLAAARVLWLERGCPTGAEARAELLKRALDGARQSQP